MFFCFCNGVGFYGFPAKYGTPNKRLETLFRHIPECRSLGFLHYKMTMTASLRAEEVERMFPAS